MQSQYFYYLGLKLVEVLLSCIARELHHGQDLGFKYKIYLFPSSKFVIFSIRNRHG